MGLIRDSLKQAMGANEVNNGFGGPQLPFRRSQGPQHRYSQYHDATYDPSPRPQTPFGRSPESRERYTQYNDSRYDAPPPYYPNDSVSAEHYSSNQYGQPFSHLRPIYNNETYTQEYSRNCPDQQFISQGPTYSNEPCPQPRRDQPFRIVALPSTSLEDGAPFLRGYSDGLAAYGISEQAFMNVVDNINIAIVPNPENQIFQKGANIAGWFVPGAAAIGLMAGQLGVGVGAAVGHSSAVAKQLSRANLELFLPRGLEICIGSGQNLDQEVGVAVSSQSPSSTSLGYTPQSRLAAYGNLIAPLSIILPPASRNGRNDPIAMLGRGLGRKEAQKKLEDAQKDVAEGKSKGKSIDASFKWLIVRKASPRALEHWRRTLQQSNSEFQQQ